MPPARALNVQGRQKSCSECVKGKRKCDNGRPRCARCSRQRLSCTYPQQPSKLPASPAFGDHSSQPEQVTRTTTELLEADAAPGPFDFDEIYVATAVEDQSFDFECATAVTSLSSFKQFTGAANDLESPIGSHSLYSPAKASSFSWTHIDPQAKARVGYAMVQLKRAPQMMVESNSTLWSHAALYDEYMPRPMQDAQAACALYNNMNDINTDFVIRHITSRVGELLTTPMPTGSVDVAARAHALMLHQVMFVFGADVRLHSHVEALLPHLEEVGSVLLDLCRQEVEPTGPLPLYPGTAARSAWRSFIRRESLRRTLLSLYQFVALCHLLLGRRDACAPSLAQGNKMTLSAHLWRAESAFDFAVVWNEKKHFVVHDLDFTEVLRDAQPDDIDDFANTMLVGLQGIDDSGSDEKLGGVHFEK
ncbi:hypothetical protein E8E12_001906 [Didymella heteroderae]|uniref:Zn(2)-C6 fungal-type domain-containing protein n=1 Tax=Didymella heteroderae TaxID=1769908 RepID=A0A9P5BZB4_9PLEO|nr:hypothetical protein E8E12_001906 [Didymella heteroderae]